MKPKLTDKQRQKIIDKHEKDIVAVIKKDPDITNISEIFCVYLDCCRGSFYTYGLDKSDNIKEKLDENRTKHKKAMKQNWRKADASPVLQIAALKLMGTESERKKLSQTFIESSGPGGGPIPYSDMTEEQIDKRLAELRDKENE